MIEILETVAPDAQTEAAVKKLVRAGFRVALDDYGLDDPRAPLAPLVHILKLDVLALDSFADRAAGHRAAQHAHGR